MMKGNNFDHKQFYDKSFNFYINFELLKNNNNNESKYFYFNYMVYLFFFFNYNKNQIEIFQKKVLILKHNKYFFFNFRLKNEDYHNINSCFFSILSNGICSKRR